LLDDLYQIVVILVILGFKIGKQMEWSEINLNDLCNDMIIYVNKIALNHKQKTVNCHNYNDYQN